MNNEDQIERAFVSAVSPKLLRHMPFIIRLDANKFSKLTKDFDKPFDSFLIDAFAETMRLLVERFHCVLGYYCDDEISLLRLDYQPLSGGMTYNGDVQTYCSMTASVATTYFKHCLHAKVEELRRISEGDNAMDLVFDSPEEIKYMENYEKLANSDVFFTSRVFNIPISEVCRYFEVRQSRGVANTVQCLAAVAAIDTQGRTTKEIIDILKQTGSTCLDPDRCDAPNGRIALRRDVDGQKMVVSENAQPFWGDHSEYLKRIIKADIEEHNVSEIYRI